MHISQKYAKAALLNMVYCRCALRLESGSMLVLDNYQIMHGRLPYEGRRQMLTVLTGD